MTIIISNTLFRLTDSKNKITFILLVQKRDKTKKKIIQQYLIYMQYTVLTEQAPVGAECEHQ